MGSLNHLLIGCVVIVAIHAAIMSQLMYSFWRTCQIIDGVHKIQCIWKSVSSLLKTQICKHTFRSLESQFVFAIRTKLRGVFFRKDIALEIGKIYGFGAVGISPFPCTRTNQMGDKRSPHGRPAKISTVPYPGRTIAPSTVSNHRHGLRLACEYNQNHGL